MKKLPIITTILAINLIFIPYIRPVLADKESYYNSNKILFYNKNTACLNDQINLTNNLSVGVNENQVLSKKLMKINDPEKFAQAINQWVTKVAPNSPFKNLGKYAVAGGQRAGINPILPIIIARKESNLGTVGQISKEGFNAFGRTATPNQPHIGTSRLWYKWPSFKQSLYSDQKDDIYQYIQQVYQNEQTIEQVMLKYAPPADNNNTELYIKQIKTWAKEIYQLASDSIDVGFYGSKADYNYRDCVQKSSSNNGLKYIYYQYQHQWANHIFTPSCGNIKQCGCGPTTLAIVIANLLDDRSITPITISDQMTGMKLAAGTTFSAFSVIPKRYDLKSTYLGTNLYHAKQALNNGGLVIMSQNSNGQFTNGGHIMALVGQTSDGHFLVADPNSKKFTENQQGFSEQVIAKGLVAMWAISL